MQPLVDLNSDRPSVNTNFLKDLLKISDTKSDTPASESKARSVQPNLSSNVSFEMLAVSSCPTICTFFNCISVMS